jgi:hypothetical protein
MKSLIVGCSSTHSSETVSPVYNIENTKHSWANVLSEKLGYDPDNQAIPGNSNQDIFHRAVEKLHNYDLLIVGWTGVARESWIYDNKHYFFNAKWACCVEDISFKDIYVKETSDATIVSDQQSMLEILDAQRRFLIEHKFDLTQQAKKMHHYRTCLQTMCQANGVRYIDANILGTVFKDAPSLKIMRHPTRDEHYEFAEQILETLK